MILFIQGKPLGNQNSLVYSIFHIFKISQFEARIGNDRRVAIFTDQKKSKSSPIIFKLSPPSESQLPFLFILSPYKFHQYRRNGRAGL